ncbi:ABC transporter substrate-binding protein [Chelatococcus asaccharovorans]|uniref:ABC transporter substrate-binding protein n=1 Tax=Chelatococcus asaccharovorans TaxID=28210 RepID=UPI00224C67F4|nr:ABC transporter substrate-binding protein [Chelatococcus asaccharovorans]CAH1649334.1 Peptide/nickel transport system substrate-binding protein [Chelatococcus asaccharovorans]CAH1687061.1 Peptide/nickel transport system substrate-binding protein [Chelatococcus asaccharovorans]
MRYRLLAGLAAVALITGAGGAFAASPPNALVIGTNLGAIPALDPAAINARTVSEVVSNLYDNLVMVNPDDLTTIRPMLAEKWTISDDKRTITMTLRKDATFASGNPVTAEDAAWTIQRVIKMGAVGSTDIALWGFTKDNVDSLVTATDPQTLVIKLPEPVSTDLVLYSLAGASLGIIDKKTALANEKNGDLAQNWLKSNSAGSGPFKLTQWRPNDILLTDARADYWGGAPAMKRVVMRHVPESGNMRLQLDAGDIDVGQYMASGDIEALEAKGATIDPGPGLGFYYIAMNTQDPDLAKPKVREAFQHILDWKPLAATTMKYNGFPWQSIIPKGMAGAPTTEPTGHEYDPEKAKKLLAEAGYPNGLKKTLYPSSDALLKMAVALQDSARKAGVEFEIVPGEHTPDFRARKFQVLVGNSGTRLPDPFGTLVQYAYNPDNRDEAKLGGYYLWRTALEAPELLKLVDQSKAETDPEKRKAIFQQVDKGYQALPPSLIITLQRTDPYVIKKGVTGYVGHPTWSTRWFDVKKN